MDVDVTEKTQHTKFVISWTAENGESVLNGEPYGSFSSLGSDHRVITGTTRLSLRASWWRVGRKAKYTWNELTTNNQLQELYAVEVRNRFQVLQENEDITAGYERFVEANQSAAEACLKQVPKVQRKERCLDRTWSPKLEKRWKSPIKLFWRIENLTDWKSTFRRRTIFTVSVIEKETWTIRLRKPRKHMLTKDNCQKLEPHQWDLGQKFILAS